MSVLLNLQFSLWTTVSSDIHAVCSGLSFRSSAMFFPNQSVQNNKPLPTMEIWPFIWIIFLTALNTIDMIDIFSFVY